MPTFRRIGRAFEARRCGRRMENAEMAPTLVFAAGDIVSESAVYDERRDALVRVDIGGKRNPRNKENWRRLHR